MLPPPRLPNPVTALPEPEGRESWRPPAFARMEPEIPDVSNIHHHFEYDPLEN